MNKIRSSIILLLAMALLSAPVVQAESNKRLQAKKVKPKAVTVQSKDKVEPASIPQTPSPTGPKQGYRLVTDVLDGLGGESQSDNYRISVNSGGQPSATGISESGDYVAQAGHVHASFVMRGDTNFDSTIDIGDIVSLVNYLLLGAYGPDPLEAGDADCSGEVDIGDIVYLLNYLLLGGMPPGC